MTLGHTAIPYLTRLWHPTTGCSLGCPGCWARDLVRNRLAGTMSGLPDGFCKGSPTPCFGPELGCGGPCTKSADPFAPTFHASRLADPLRARKPQVIGVSFLGDLFDAAITDEQIDEVWGIMAVATQHTFIVLTKQASRMNRWMRSRTEKWRATRANIVEQYGDIRPLPNVWLGVSVSTAGDSWRVLDLQRTPAAHRWVSAEPLLGEWNLPLAGGAHDLPQIDAVVVGGMSGTVAKPMHPGWVRTIRDECAAAGVDFAFKQWGEWAPDCRCSLNRPTCQALPRPEPGLPGAMFRCGTRKAGRLLGGFEHWPPPWVTYCPDCGREAGR
jgi:protein gp37